MIYLELFIGFLKVGLFAFGGAYAAVPFIREVVLSYGWLSDNMLTDMIAVSESTPGSIMINLATYVGSSQGGILGAAIATAAVVLPAFLIIILVMGVFRNILDNRWVKAALGGMKPCVTGIISATGCYMIFRSCFGSFTEIKPDVTALIITGVLSLIYFGSRIIKEKGISPITLIVISALAGIAVYGI